MPKYAASGALAWQSEMELISFSINLHLFIYGRYLRWSSQKEMFGFLNESGGFTPL